jgi:hypothetical protein
MCIRQERVIDQYERLLILACAAVLSLTVSSHHRPAGGISACHCLTEQAK